jgi:Protein of unknown function (DUF559)
MSLNGPFTLQRGLEDGLSERVLRGPAYQRLLHGVYAPAGVTPTTTVRARAALLLAPEGALLARQTAATLWGGVVPASPDIQLVLPPGSRLRVSGVDARVRRRPETVVHNGLPLTSPAQTFLDLASDLDLVDMVVVGDSLVGAGVTRPEELVAAAAASRGRRARTARRAAAYVRGGVDSPMESRLRMLLLLAGLPEPVVNHALRDETGRVRYRLDLSFPQWRIAIEYDGRQHAENTAQWRWDVQRREDLDADGWRLVVVLSGDIYRSPGRTLERVVSAARAQGVSLRLRSDEWRRYFPQRD